MTANAKIQSIVRVALKRRFPKMRVVRIDARETFDHEDDPIIDIKVIFDDEKSEFVAGRLIEIPGLIIPELSKIGAAGFPILHYIAKSEWETASPEAA